PGPGGIAVVVEQNDSILHHARVEEFETLPVRFVDHAVQMHETEAPIGVALERVVKVAFDELHRVRKVVSPNLLKKLPVGSIGEATDLLAVVVVAAKADVDLHVLTQAFEGIEAINTLAAAALLQKQPNRDQRRCLPDATLGYIAVEPKH